MSVTIMFASLALVQAAAPAVVVEGSRDRVDVAYAELVDGRPAAAITRIRANRELEADDPAALINLGTAHARLGRPAEAHGYYIAAIGSGLRYDLQLADGRWMDSRRAARTAIRMLGQGSTLAVR